MKKKRLTPYSQDIDNITGEKHNLVDKSIKGSHSNLSDLKRERKEIRFERDAEKRAARTRSKRDIKKYLG